MADASQPAHPHMRNNALESLPRLGGVEDRIVAAAARTEATRARIRQELGDAVATFDNAGAVLAGPALDAVMIAVPEPLHEPTLLAVLDTGLDADMCYFRDGSLGLPPTNTGGGTAVDLNQTR